MTSEKNTSEAYVLVVLTVGKSDNGKNATLAFSCGLSALAMGRRSAVFLTSDGAIWGYSGSADDIRVQGFPMLGELISNYIDSGGEVILCSVCHKTCSSGSPNQPNNAIMLDGVTIGGFASMIDRGIDGMTVTF